MYINHLLSFWTFLFFCTFITVCYRNCVVPKKNEKKKLLQKIHCIKTEFLLWERNFCLKYRQFETDSVFVRNNNWKKRHIYWQCKFRDFPNPRHRYEMILFTIQPICFMVFFVNFCIDSKNSIYKLVFTCFQWNCHATEKTSIYNVLAFPKGRLFRSCDFFYKVANANHKLHTWLNTSFSIWFIIITNDVINRLNNKPTYFRHTNATKRWRFFPIRCLFAFNLWHSKGLHFYYLENENRLVYVWMWKHILLCRKNLRSRLHTNEQKRGHNHSLSSNKFLFESDYFVLKYF